MSLVPTANEKKIGFNLEIEINSDKNNSFSLIMNTENDSYLLIKAIQKNDLFHNSFSNKYTLKQLNENRYFALFDNLKEICNELSDRIKTKEIKLIENLNNLIFTISLPIAKLKEISFELNKEQKDDKEKINDLNNLVINLENKINELKKEHKNDIDELKNVINEQKNVINELKNVINGQKNEILELKEQIKICINYINNKESIKNLNDSLIINNNNDYNKLIKEWINPNKKIEAELLYRLSRDGDQISTFHQLCDNKGPTLTLFYTQDGNKGGIYTPLTWDTKSETKKDKETFMFNLNKNEKYKKIDEKKTSIFCTKDYGPWTYSFGFYKDNSMKKIKHMGFNINNAYEKGSNILLNNSNETKYFNIIEVEVYKIIFNN